MPRKEQPMEEAGVLTQTYSLPNDMGGEVVFEGRLVAEHEYFDEETGVLTRQKLYETSEGYKAYAVIASDGRTRERRAYLIRREGRICRIHNGQFEVTVNGEDLVRVVRGLCGLTDAVRSEDFFALVEEAFRQAVNE